MTYFSPYKKIQTARTSMAPTFMPNVPPTEYRTRDDTSMPGWSRISTGDTIYATLLWSRGAELRDLPVSRDDTIYAKVTWYSEALKEEKDEKKQYIGLRNSGLSSPPATVMPQNTEGGSVGDQEPVAGATADVSSETHTYWDVPSHSHMEVPIIPQNVSERAEVVSKPTHLHGQRSGALLHAKRIPATYTRPMTDKAQIQDLVIEVGDICEIKRFYFVMDISGKKQSRVLVVNRRTGSEMGVTWDTFFAVGTREMCGCPDQNCRCVYDDYEKSKAFFEG